MPMGLGHTFDKGYPYRAPRPLVNKVRALGQQWQERQAHGHLWATRTAMLDGAFREIVALGWHAVPAIIELVQEEPSWLVTALREITGEVPTRPDTYGDPLKCDIAWWVNWWNDLGPKHIGDRNLPENVRLVTCANCEADLLGETMRYRFHRPPSGWPQFMAGRYRGRPYCRPCLQLVRAVVKE